jgi:uncharacterized membrane protein
MSPDRTAVKPSAEVAASPLDPSRNGAFASAKPIRLAAVGVPGRVLDGPDHPDRMMRPTRAAAENARVPTSGKGSDGMAIGPVQLIVLGFDHPEFRGEIIAELEKLRESDTVRVIDSLAVYKDADGELEVQHLSNLSTDEAIELGTVIGALIGLGIEGEEGAEAGAVAGAEAMADGVNLLDPDEWDVLEDIPNDSAAALILIEHHWAVGLRDAVARAGGSRIGDAFISPLDLVEIGLLSADEKELHALESTGGR